MSVFDSTTSIAAMRPLIAAGPMVRAFIPARSSGSIWALAVMVRRSERRRAAGLDARIWRRILNDALPAGAGRASRNVLSGGGGNGARRRGVGRGRVRARLDRRVGFLG